jgi:chromosome segregation ATPase
MLPVLLSRTQTTLQVDASKKANDAARDAASKIELVKTIASEKSISIQSRLNEFDERRSILDSQINNARILIVDMNATIAKNRTDIEEIEKSIEARRKFLGEQYAAFGALNDLIDQTSRLRKQVSLIDAALKEVAKHVNATESVSGASGVQEVSKEIQKALGAQLPPRTDVKPTVFVQFAGSRREQINELIEKIGADNKYILPGAERLSTAQESI